MATPHDIDAVKSHLKRLGKNQRWRDGYVEKIDAKLLDKNAASYNALSETQRRLLAAMDDAPPMARLPGTLDEAIDEPEIPLPLRVPLPDVPPGSVVVVEDRPAKRR